MPWELPNPMKSQLVLDFNNVDEIQIMLTPALVRIRHHWPRRPSRPAVWGQV